MFCIHNKEQDSNLVLHLLNDCSTYMSSRWVLKSVFYTKSRVWEVIFFFKEIHWVYET